MAARSDARSGVESADRAQETLRLLSKALAAGEAERRRLHEQVVLLNIGVAEAIARRFRNRGEPLDDLMQVAYLGLTKAVRGFDPDKGEEFLSYAAPTISGELKRHFRDTSWVIRPPRRIQELQAAISSAAAELTQEFGRSPRPSELAARLGADVEDVTEALASDGCFTPASLDEKGPREDGEALADRLGLDDPEMQRAEAVAVLRPLCRRLPPRDQHILYLRFFRGWTQAQIAAELGVTQMQVSRLLSRILASLREDLTEGDDPDPSHGSSSAA
jgi:RNA polymerase sigma-B factor